MLTLFSDLLPRMSAKYIIIDNGVLSKLRRSPENYMYFLTKAGETLGWTLSPPLFLTTPFAFLEGIWIGFPKSPPVPANPDLCSAYEKELLKVPPNSNVLYKLCEKIFIDIFEKHHSYLDELPVLQQDSIKLKLQKFLDRCDGPLKDFLTKIFQPIAMNLDQRNFIIKRLAVEHTYGTSFPETLRDHLYTFVMATFTQGIIAKDNLSHTRGLYKAWLDFRINIESFTEEELREKNYLAPEMTTDLLKANLSFVQDLAQLTDNADLLDGELFHYVMFGTYDQEGWHSVDVLTFENAETNIGRLSLFKSMASASYGTIIEKMGGIKQHPYPAKYGKIIVLDQDTFEIKKVINASDVVPAFHIFGREVIDIQKLYP